MQGLLLRWGINAVAVYAAVSLVPGIHAQGTDWISVILLGLILGLLNALVRPILKLLTCPLIFLTLGLFTLVINTLIFWLAGVIGNAFGVGFTADGFWPVFLGGLIVTAVSVLLTLVLKDELRPARR